MIGTSTIPTANGGICGEDRALTCPDRNGAGADHFVRSARLDGGLRVGAFNAEWGRLHPRRKALMSLAGPFANLLLALLALGAMRALLAAPRVSVRKRRVEYAIRRGDSRRRALATRALAMALGVMLKLNVVLFLFNLIPVPHLTAAGVCPGFFPETFGSLLRANENRCRVRVSRAAPGVAGVPVSR